MKTTFLIKVIDAIFDNNRVKVRSIVPYQCIDLDIDKIKNDKDYLRLALYKAKCLPKMSRSKHFQFTMAADCGTIVASKETSTCKGLPLVILHKL